MSKDDAISIMSNSSLNKKQDRYNRFLLYIKLLYIKLFYYI